MTPRDFALEIEPGASPARLDQIEQVLHKFAAEIFVQEAILIDDAAMDTRINYAHQAAAMLRDKAHEHLNQT